jgi:hypothetical protein
VFAVADGDDCGGGVLMHHRLSSNQVTAFVNVEQIKLFLPILRL